MKSNRPWRHCTLLIFSALTSVTIYYLSGAEQTASGISIATAYASLIIFLAAMLIGPINILLSRPNPLSSYLRRDLGIWSAILALIHTIVGLQVHLSGQFWLYFLYPDDQAHIVPVRYDLFGLSNHLGLICSILMLLLLLLSNNYSIRKLGHKKWKRWQRSTYLLAFALPLHGYIYQFLENRIGPFTIILSVIFALGIIIQVASITKYRKTSSQYN